MQDQDRRQEISNAVTQAIHTRRALNIQGGNSKTFYGNAATGKPLDVSGHKGIVDYEPSELFITARSGTPLQVITSTLDEQNQMLAFERRRSSSVEMRRRLGAVGFSLARLHGC